MKSETHVFVHLPSGERFEMDRSGNYEALNNNEIDEIRKLFGAKDMTSVQFTACPDKHNGLQKNKVIILWGDVLKNSWIEIVNY